MLRPGRLVQDFLVVDDRRTGNLMVPEADSDRGDVHDGRRVGNPFPLHHLGVKVRQRRPVGIGGSQPRR